MESISLEPIIRFRVCALVLRLFKNFLLTVTILMLLATVLCLHVVMLKSGGIDSYYHANNFSTMSSDWELSEAIKIIIDYNEKIYPSEYILASGTLINGSLISFIANDSDYLYVKVDDQELQLYLYMESDYSGLLYVEAVYDIYYEIGGETEVIRNAYYLNMSIFDPVTETFKYLGLANGSPYHISPGYITGDGRIIIKIYGFGEYYSYTYFIARISYAHLRQDPVSNVVSTEYKRLSDKSILHRMIIEIEKPNATIYLANVSPFWKFIDAEPEISWNYTTRSFQAKYPGEYVIYFESSDYWNYESSQMMKIVIIDTRGNVIPLDLFDVYYRFIKMKVNYANETLFKRNITIGNPSELVYPDYPLLLALNSSVFNFLAARPDLGDIYFTQEMGGKEVLLPHYIEYWDGKVANIWIKVRRITYNATLIMHYGSEEITVQPNVMAKSLILFYDDFSSSQSLNNWTYADLGWKIVSSTDVSVLHHEASNEISWILTQKVFPSVIIARTKVYYTFNESSSRAFWGNHLIFNSSNNLLTLRFEKNATGNFVIVYAVINGTKYINSTLLEDLGDRAYITAYIDYLTKRIIVDMEIISPYNTIYTQLSLKDVSMPLEGYYGFFCANTSFSSEYVNITYYLSNDKYLPRITQISNEMIDTSAIITQYTADSDYKRLFINTIEVPSSSLINLVIKDIFGGIVFNDTLHPRETLIIPIEVYSFKVKNNRDDLFVHFYIAKDNATLSWSEWLAPGEITEYILRPGDYSIKIDYLGDSGGSLEMNITIRSDMYFMINGTVLGDLIYQLQQINSSIINQIHHINLRLTNINSTINNISVNFLVEIDNINSTLSGLIAEININLTNIRSEIQDMLTEVSYELHNIESMMNDLGINLSNLVSLTNSSISQILIDLNNSIMIVYTDMEALLSNISLDIVTINSTILNFSSYLVSALLSVNASINNILVDLESNIISMNTSLGCLLLNISSQMIIMNTSVSNLLLAIAQMITSYNSSLSSMILELLNKFVIINSTFFEIIWNLNSSILMINSTISSLYLDMSNYIIELNATINSFIASVKDNIFLIDTEIHMLNETLLLSLYDLQLNISKNIMLSLRDLENLTKYILQLVKVYKITLVNKYTMQKVSANQFTIKVNGTVISDTTFTTIANAVKVEIIDYWGRVIWSNVTSNQYIKAYLDLGRIIIINERFDALEVLLAPENSSDPVKIIVPPMEYYDLQVYANCSYNITIKTSERVLSSSIHRFTKRNGKEPMILLKISGEEVFVYPTRQNTWLSIWIPFLSGIGLSGLITGIHRIIVSRRLSTISAEELLQRLIRDANLEANTDRVLAQQENTS